MSNLKATFGAAGCHAATPAVSALVFVRAGRRLSSSTCYANASLPMDADGSHGDWVPSRHRSLLRAAVTGTMTGLIGGVLGGWDLLTGVEAPTAPSQRAALVQMYIATTNGSAWSNRTGWENHGSGSDPCDNSWAGITCDGSSGAMSRNV
jgi:hypothetical protein